MKEAKFKVVTQTAIHEDGAEARIAVEMHVVEMMEILHCVNYYCRNAKPRFDCAPHSYRLRDLIKIMRDGIGSFDPEYCEQMFGKELPPFPANIVPSPAPTVREIHHHHYTVPRHGTI